MEARIVHMEEEIINAVKALNFVTISWLVRCLTTMGELNRRPVRLKLWGALPSSNSKFLEKQDFLRNLCSSYKQKVNQKILSDAGLQSIEDAINRLNEASYPLFANDSVEAMSLQSFQVSDFPSVDSYLVAVQQLQGAIINLEQVLVFSFQYFNDADIGKRVELRNRCKTDTSVTFTETDLTKYITLSNAGEVNMTVYIRGSLEPQIEHLSGLMLQAERMKAAIRL